MSSIAVDRAQAGMDLAAAVRPGRHTSSASRLRNAVHVAAARRGEEGCGDLQPALPSAGRSAGRAARTWVRARLASWRVAAGSRPIVSAIFVEAQAEHVVEQEGGALER
jgi:hypothetical protein